MSFTASEKQRGKEVKRSVLFRTFLGLREASSREDSPDGVSYTLLRKRPQPGVKNQR